MLNVTQVFDMHVVSKVGERGKKVYRAWIPGSKDPERPDEEPMWIEMSISSTKIGDLLKQNEALGVGQETAWKVEDFLTDGTLSSIYVPACTLVRKMDGIGFYNDNGLVPSIGRFNPAIPAALSPW